MEMQVRRPSDAMVYAGLAGDFHVQAKDIVNCAMWLHNEDRNHCSIGTAVPTAAETSLDDDSFMFRFVVGHRRGGLYAFLSIPSTQPAPCPQP